MSLNLCWKIQLHGSQARREQSYGDGRCQKSISFGCAIGCCIGLAFLSSCGKHVTWWCPNFCSHRCAGCWHLSSDKQSWLLSLMTPGVPTLVDSIPTDENCEMLTGAKALRSLAQHAWPHGYSCTIIFKNTAAVIGFLFYFYFCICFWFLLASCIRLELFPFYLPFCWYRLMRPLVYSWEIGTVSWCFAERSGFQGFVLRPMIKIFFFEK
jgi:hypothetical protein